mmetsp:Transcript_7951/g.11693  ORF Transcript_7951/g.11693 Transcript_7951/m.11693 type:complete len:311 (+) Transcript_7951:140-1072(+)
MSSNAKQDRGCSFVFTTHKNKTNDFMNDGKTKNNGSSPPLSSSPSSSSSSTKVTNKHKETTQKDKIEAHSQEDENMDLEADNISTATTAFTTSNPPPNRSSAPPKKTTPKTKSTKQQFSKKDKHNDPHNIVPRFVKNHLLMFPLALQEIQYGEKRSCWSWFILPTAPYIVDGVERGSLLNRRFALRNEDAVDAYLSYCQRHPHPSYEEEEEDEEEGRIVVVNLRQNYIDIVKAVHKQLVQGNTMTHLFGPLDDVKAISSFQLFEKAGIRLGDEELCSVCRNVLDFIERGKKRRKRKERPIWKYFTSSQSI